MNFLQKLEKRLDEIARRLSGGRAGAREPIEITCYILREMEGKIATLRGGERIFPFDKVTVHLYAEDEERRALYEAAFLSEQNLASAIREHLRPPKCTAPARLSVEVLLDESPPDESAEKGFRVVYGRRRAGQAYGGAGHAERPRLVVEQGEATPREYEITKQRTNIGRQAVVNSTGGQPLRRNDLVFVENGDEVNQTVSRLHAHIRLDRSSGEFRLYDDNSAYGTLIIRADGKHVKVSGGLGATLQPGDELYFGKACVRFVTD